MIVALVHLGSALAILAGWLFLAIATAPLVGKFLRGPRSDVNYDFTSRHQADPESPLEQTRVEMLRRAERAHAAAARARARRVV